MIKRAHTMFRLDGMAARMNQIRFPVVNELLVHLFVRTRFSETIDMQSGSKRCRPRTNPFWCSDWAEQLMTPRASHFSFSHGHSNVLTKDHK